VLEILHSQGDDALAKVFVVRTDGGAAVECVESLQPPLPRERKWILIVSTLAGCPVQCVFCDAGGSYQGRLSAQAILEQVDFLVRRRFPTGTPPVHTLKVQLARMGEPTFNPAVLEVLRELPARYPVPNLVASLSTVAPRGAEDFLAELPALKERLYPGGRFQMQLSLHATNEERRRALIPVKCLSFEELARWGERFFRPGDRKIGLNFAAADQAELDPSELRRWFSPELFLVKLTPLNPTGAVARAGLTSVLAEGGIGRAQGLVGRFREQGYEVIVAIGEPRENEIGSNCGMYLRRAEALGAA
jgi:23S rRNA (adenine2503-C2)-methyltransferase